MTLAPVSIPGRAFFETISEMGRRTELAAWRKANGMDQEALASRLGVSRSSVAAYESGQTRSVPPHVVSLLRGMGFTGTLSQSESSLSEVEIMVPYIGPIIGAPPDTYPTSIEVKRAIPGHMTVEECFAGDVIDDAMMPLLTPGSVAVIKPTAEPKLNQVVLWAAPSGMVIRRYSHDGRDFILVAENSRYEPIPAEGRALGIVLGYVMVLGDATDTRYVRSGLR